MTALIPEALHEIGVGLGIEIISPGQGNMFSGQNRIFITVINTVVEIRLYIFRESNFSCFSFLCNNALTY